MKNDEIKQAEARLQRIALQRRQSQLASEDGALRIVEAFYQEMTQLLIRTSASVSTVIKLSDSEGNIQTRVVPGVSIEVLPEHAVVYSNIKSKKARAARLRKAIDELEEIMRDLRQHRDPPTDLRDRLEELRASIPADTNEFQLIGGPKSSVGRPKPSPMKGKE